MVANGVVRARRFRSLFGGVLSLALAAGALVVSSSARAQEGTQEPGPRQVVAHQQQLWLGFLTQTRFADRYSWWNDAHFVPGAFYIARTGLTYHFSQELSATAGYAYLGLPLGTVTRNLERREHRPWAQVVHNLLLDEQWSVASRFRYDARFRRNVEEGALAPGYGLTNRARLQMSVRRDFSELSWGRRRMVPYLSVANEVLVDAGPAGVRLDQNRITAGLGVAGRRVAVQASYMNRFVHLTSPSPAGAEYMMNHTLVLWVFHHFDVRRRGQEAD